MDGHAASELRIPMLFPLIADDDPVAPVFLQVRLDSVEKPFQRTFIVFRWKCRVKKPCFRQLRRNLKHLSENFAPTRYQDRAASNVPAPSDEFGGVELFVDVDAVRITQLTNAFSKKVENHAAAISLHFMHYNFARVHQTLRCTPAMRAGVTDHKWSIEEIVDLLPILKYNTRPKKAQGLD